MVSTDFVVASSNFQKMSFVPVSSPFAMSQNFIIRAAKDLNTEYLQLPFSVVCTTENDQ
jgi:hypothetical protein